MGIDRRTFLSHTAKAAVAAAALGVIDMRVWAQTVQDAPVVKKPSLCNMCTSECGMHIHVKNGRPWKVTGHPDHPVSRGKLCPRAHAGLHWIYDPARVKTPLKRVGEWQFEPISWEQATDQISDQLKRIIAEHGTESVFGAQYPRTTGSLYLNRLMHALGVSTTQSHEATCQAGRRIAMSHTFGAAFDADWENSDYLLFIGRNMGEAVRTASATAFAKAIERGAKVVCVDPRLSQSAAITEWVPIKPGTDLALLLALCNVLVTENLFDRQFISNHTNGFVPFRRHVVQYSPHWAEEITGVPAEKIRQIAHEMAAAAPHCAVDTGWKAAVGSCYANSTDTGRAVAYVNGLLGNIGQRGGISVPPGVVFATPQFPAPSAPTAPRNDGVGTEYPLASAESGLPHLTMQRAKEGKVKAGFIRHFNPVRSFPDYDHMRAGMRALDLLVVFETHMSETAIEAHYILPEPSFAEREEVVKAVGDTVAMRTKAIDSVHPQTKSFDEIITMLAYKLGVGEYFSFTLDQWNEALLADQPFSLADLKRAGTLAAEVSDEPVLPAGCGSLIPPEQQAPKERPRAFLVSGGDRNPVPQLFTPSGRFEFYSQRFANAGFEPIAKWYPPKTGLDLGSAEFRVVHGKQAYHSHVATNNIPILAQITKDYDTNRLWMNRSRAEQLGISDNDTIRMRARNGRTAEARVMVTERVHPDMLFSPAGYGNRTPYYKTSKELGGFNPHDLAEYQHETISGHTMMSELIVEVERA